MPRTDYTITNRYDGSTITVSSPAVAEEASRDGHRVTAVTEADA
jgi:hypothetical protein